MLIKEKGKHPTSKLCSWMHIVLVIYYSIRFLQDDESPDIDFVYADSDSLAAELAEFYSYTEQVKPGTEQRIGR